MSDKSGRWQKALFLLVDCEGHEWDGELTEREIAAREQTLLLAARMLERAGAKVDREALAAGAVRRSG